MASTAGAAPAACVRPVAGSQPPSCVQDRVAAWLCEQGRVAEAELAAARAARAEGGAGGLLFHLVEQGSVSPESAAEALRSCFGVDTVVLSRAVAEPAALARLDGALARDWAVLPLQLRGRMLRVAVLDPYDLELLQRLRAWTGLDVDPLLADEHSLRRAIEGSYTSRLALEQRAGRAARHVLDGDAVARPSEQDDAADAEVPRLVEEVMVDAVERGASDVHFEFYEAFGRIRYRIDGHLVETTRALDPRIGPHVVNRIKVIAAMSSAQDRVPDDGTTSQLVRGRRVDFRVSTLPTAVGVEKVVLRVLERDESFRGVDQLGIEGRDRELLLAAARRSHGMILVTGPTGSGKSTTLYSLLDHLNETSRNLITVEDPVERRIAGIQQVQVRPHADARLDLSYPVVLRAMLRQDPDVIMIGEMRDALTTQMALRAAMTGHLVLSTLHTNDTASTVTRLVDMGVERFNLTGSVTLIVAQRLMRRVCARCREPHVPSAEECQRAGVDPSLLAGANAARGRGCDACAGTGYRERVGVYEVLPVTRALRAAIAAGATEDEVRDLAAAGGMTTLRDAALQRVREGASTLAEMALAVNF